MSGVKKSVIFLVVVALASAVPIDQTEIVKNESEIGQEIIAPVVLTEKVTLADRNSVHLIAENVKSVVDALREVNERAFDLVQAYVSRIVDVSKTAATDVQTIPDVIPEASNTVAIVTVPEDEIIVEKSLLSSSELRSIARDDAETEAEVEKDKPTDEAAQDKPNDNAVKDKPNDEEQSNVNRKPLHDQQANKISSSLHDALKNYKKAINQFIGKIKVIPDSIFKKISGHFNLNAVIPKSLEELSDTIRITRGIEFTNSHDDTQEYYTDFIEI